VVAAIWDVTVQRQATAAQAELATIVRTSLDATISTASEGRISSWDPAAALLFDCPRADVVGEHIAALAPEGESMVLEEWLDGVPAGRLPLATPADVTGTPRGRRGRVHLSPE
jgi:PAS domain-containing protein